MTLTFPARQTQQTVFVPTSTDSVVEAMETFGGLLSSPSDGASLGQATASVEIVDATGV